MDPDPRAMLCRVKGTLALCVLVWGCTDARSNAGAECARNSQCAAPLVCALERCRNECNQSRDCPVGSSCVRSESGFGVCLLQDETSCGNDNDCAGALVCALSRCTSRCGDGCAPGTECRDDACFDPAMDTSCSRDGECTEGVCVAGRCRAECRSNRDCRFGGSCIDGRCGGSAPADAMVPLDVPRSDSGVVDPFCPARTADVVDICTSKEFSQHTCAALSDGRVACWGNNSALKLGSADLPRGAIFSPALVDGIDNAVGVACAPWGSCAVLADGRLTCWGVNTLGQTGTGSPSNQVVTPLDVPTLTNVVDVSLHAEGGCALDGTQVYCWGTNDVGQLGTAGGSTRSPVLATDLPPATAVSISEGRFLGQTHGYVVTTDGDLVAFGGNPFPEAVDLSISGSDLIDVAAGEQHVCVLRSGGEVLCAGDNFYGQIGVSDATGSEFTSVVGLEGVTAIRARSSANCVITPTEGLCWGDNTFGALGVGEMTGNQRTPAPVTLPGSGPPTVLESGHQYGCAIYAGVPYCFGHNDAFAALGLGPDPRDTFEPTTPVICLP